MRSLFLPFLFCSNLAMAHDMVAFDPKPIQTCEDAIKNFAQENYAKGLDAGITYSNQYFEQSLKSQHLNGQSFEATILITSLTVKNALLSVEPAHIAEAISANTLQKGDAKSLVLKFCKQ